MSRLGVSIAFAEIGSDPYGEWEEDGYSGLDFDINLNSTLCSSQEIENAVSNEDEEKYVNVLHYLADAEVIDVEHDGFLEDTFVLPAESSEKIIWCIK